MSFLWNGDIFFKWNGKVSILSEYRTLTLKPKKSSVQLCVWNLPRRMVFKWGDCLFSSIIYELNVGPMEWEGLIEVSSAFDDHLQSFNGILSLLFGLFGRIWGRVYPLAGFESVSGSRIVVIATCFCCGWFDRAPMILPCSIW